MEPVKVTTNQLDEYFRKYSDRNRITHGVTKAIELIDADIKEIETMLITINHSRIPNLRSQRVGARGALVKLRKRLEALVKGK